MGVLTRLLQAETRDSTLKAPDAALIEALRGGIGTAAGVTVSDEAALAYGAVLACVRVLSESVASLPFILYERIEQEGQEGKRRATGHALYRVLHNRPNPEMSAFELWEMSLVHLLMWGNFYAEIVTDGRGEVSALWPIPPKLVQPRREEGTRRLVYDIRLSQLGDGQADTTLGAEWIFHVAGLRTSGLRGLSVIGLAREAIGLGLAAQQYGAAVFANGAVPGGVLEHPGALSDQAWERLRSSWNDRHQGLENAQRVAILEEGIKYNKTGIPPEDAQFLETRKFQRSEIAGMFRVPPHMVGDLERATFSNIEQQSLEYVVYSLGPWLRRIEARVNGWLLLPRDQTRYFGEFLVEGLLRGDINSRYQAYATGKQWGWLSSNEIRQRENMNPVAGGDTYLQPLNMITAGEAGEAERGRAGEGERRLGLETGRSEGERLGLETGRSGGERLGLETGRSGGERLGLETGRSGGERRSEGEVERTGRARQRLSGSYRRTLEETARRLVNREVNDVRNAARRRLAVRDGTLRSLRSLPEFEQWLEAYYVEFVTVAREYLLPSMTTLAELTRDDVERETGERWSDAEMETWITEYADGRARHWASEHRRALEAAAAGAEDPLAAVEATLGELQTTTPERFAQEHSVRVVNAVAATIYTAFLLSMRWFAFGESCDYCAELNGRIVGSGGYFVQSGDELVDAAGAVFRAGRGYRHAPLHSGCDCTVLAA